MPSETLSPITIRVGGREFRPVAETSFEQDMFIMQVLRDAGLSALTDKFNPAEDELDELAQNLIIRAFASGKLFVLLAATLEEVGTEWSMSTSAINATFFSKLRKTEDKEALRGSIVGILTGFLISGVLSSMTSRKSSPSVAFTTSLPHSDVVPQPSSEDLAVGVLSPTASGRPSSERSPDMTLTDSP